MPKKLIVSTDAPGWLVTFGDMMTQILCFFVMLFSMAEPGKKSMESPVATKGHFNVSSPVSDKEVDTANLAAKAQRRLQSYEPRFAPSKGGGKQKISHHFGQYVLVRKVRDAVRVVLGDKASFAAGSLQMPPEMDTVLAQLAEQIAGQATRIEIRGHVSPDPEDILPGMDKWDLSWRRAQVVARALEAKGVDPRRFRISGLAQYDPVASNVADLELSPRVGRAWNRRVEIVILPEVVPELVAQGAGR